MVTGMKLLDHTTGTTMASWVQKKKYRLGENGTEENGTEGKRLEEEGIEEKRIEQRRLEKKRTDEKRLEEEQSEEKLSEEKPLEVKQTEQERSDHKRLEDDLTIIEEEEKQIFAGLVYFDCEKKNISYNTYSQHYIAWQARQKLLQQGFIVSPIFTKALFFNPINFTIIQEKKQHFYSLLKSIMDDSYVGVLQQIYDFPPIVPAEYSAGLSEQIHSLATQRERDDFLLLVSQLRLNRRCLS